jgi:hypothetical protein
MADGDYSKRELDYHFTEVKEELREIKAQTTRTNGRVTALEKWMWMVVGALTLITFLMGSKLINLTPLL